MAACPEFYGFGLDLVNIPFALHLSITRSVQYFIYISYIRLSQLYSLLYNRSEKSSSREEVRDLRQLEPRHKNIMGISGSGRTYVD